VAEAARLEVRLDGVGHGPEPSTRPPAGDNLAAARAPGGRAASTAAAEGASPGAAVGVTPERPRCY